LVLAAHWPESSWLLIEAGQQRAAFLRRTVVALGWETRVVVAATRVEEVGRGPERAAMELVTARSFGPPAVTAECGAPLLQPGGRLIVSEPPEGSAPRWPAGPLEALGLMPRRLVHGEASYMVLVQVTRSPDRFPRRTGVPAKRPLF
jgi:16S rRNA (guanine527-N7)-methyltransferase